MRPVVGALCFGLRRKDFDDELQATTFETFPTLYDFVELDDDAGFAARPDYPPDELVPVGATGAACLIIHRSLLETIRTKYGDNWFSPASHPCGRTFSEDLSFFVRVAGVDASDLRAHRHPHRSRQGRRVPPGTGVPGTTPESALNGVRDLLDGLCRPPLVSRQVSIIVER